jgi:hypothetical protein
LSSLSAKWMDLSIPVTSVGAFDANNARQISLDVSAAGAGPWTNPTVVYIDSIRSSNLVVNDTFDTSSVNLVSSSFVVVTGSTITWAAGIP